MLSHAESGPTNASGRIGLSVADGVAHVTIDQPSKRNAISIAMWQQLRAVLAEAEGRPDIAVLALRGAGEQAFCSGGDIDDYPALAADPSLGHDYHDRYSALLRALRRFAKPSVAMIRGACYGAGLAIAASCDFRISAEDGRFGITALKRGLIYPLEELRQLQGLIGVAALRRLVLRGLPLDAAQALKAGLVDEVCPASELEMRGAALIAELAQQSGEAYARTKRLLEESLFGTGRETPALREVAVAVYGGPEFLDGTQDFLAGARRGLSRPKRPRS